MEGGQRGAPSPGQRWEGDGKSPLGLLCWVISPSRMERHPPLPGLSVPAKEPQRWHRSCTLLPCQPAGLQSLKAASGLALQLEGRGPRLKPGDAAHGAAPSTDLQNCAAAPRTASPGLGVGSLSRSSRQDGSKACQQSGKVRQRHMAGEEQTHCLHFRKWKK